MSNAIIGIDKSGSYRVYAAVTTEMVGEAARIHDTTPVASAALGRVLTAAGLMGIMLKSSGDKLTINFKGDGPAKQILATAHGDGTVKGYIANPYIELPLKENGKLDVGGAVGKGELTVIKDLGLREPYVGTVELVSGEIAEDMTAYFFISEQQNSSVALGVRVERDLSVGAAGGMVIQMLPGAEEGAVDALEKMLGGMEPLTAIINRIMENSPGLSESDIIMRMTEEIFAGMPDGYALQILEQRQIGWECDCSRERMARALATIGRDDLREIVEEDGKAELQCHFCLSSYEFSRQELEDILNGM